MCAAVHSGVEVSEIADDLERIRFAQVAWQNEMEDIRFRFSQVIYKAV